MHIIIAGGTGMVGTMLTTLLEREGHRVQVLTRDLEAAEQSSDFLFWDIQRGEVDPGLAYADVVVHLAGAGIADGRWTTSRKKAIIESRTKSNTLLIKTLKERHIRLRSSVAASAIGYYGDAGHHILQEEDPVQTKEFLSDVCVLWEASSAQAASITEYLCTLRIGTVLSREGGALAKMDATIPFGMANYLGTGKQMMSWIHIEDMCRLIWHSISVPLHGIFNAVAPDVVSNKDFTATLKDVINPSALLLPAPALAIKALFGEMSRVVLNSNHVSADKILSTGFNFKYPTLEEALGALYSQ